MENKELIISENLQRLGVPCNIAGFAFTKEAVSMVIDDVTVIHGRLHKVLFHKVADKFNTTAPSVEKCVRTAVGVIWDVAPAETIAEILGPAAQKRKMTPAEFIATFAERIRLGRLDRASWEQEL
jgi:two-component system response regulator (stage 0 sporulation protein A)